MPMCLQSILIQQLLIFVGVYSLYVTNYLYTRKNPEIPISIENEGDLNVSKPVIVIIHGHLGFSLQNYELEIKDRYLKKGDYNVILTDWSMNNNDGYGRSVMMAKIVGKFTGEFFFTFYEDYSLMHFIGIELGAHIAGFASKQIKKYTNGKHLVSRITAIDPVAPMFNVSNPTERLDANDASMVIVYHCDGHVVGIFEPIGRVDFYINGGVRLQPGCHDENPSFLNSMYGNIEKYFCSHLICRSYFIDSLHTSDITALKCNDSKSFNLGLCNDNEKIVFGDNLPEYAKGTYFLNLSANSFY